MQEHVDSVNILIVDDRDENLLSLEGIIEGPGRKIMQARSGKEGLKLNMQYDFDLILSDVQMPEMDGFEMLEILRTNPAKRSIPFIFITAISKEDHFIKRGYHEGAVDYLFKPLNVDITRSKVDVFVQLAQQKKQLINKNVQLNWLYQQKNQYLGMLAHDLRNPIGVFQHYCQFLIEDKSSPITQEQHYLVKHMMQSAGYMLNLVNDVLDVSHLESGQIQTKLESCDIGAFVKDVVMINGFFAKEKQIQLTSSLPDDLPTALIDAPKIRQVLNNLISNALKYSFSNTTVLVNVRTDKEKLYFDVIDQGQGIPQNEIGNLFKPFKGTSVKSTAGEKSTGLGLLICAKIIEAHGGYVSVTSEVGKGSTFSFSLPLVAVKKMPTIKAAPVSHTLEPKIIGVADDDKTNQQIMKRLLEAKGHKVFLANNGTEAILIAKEHAIDLFFMDLEMPILNGIDAAQAILNSDALHKPIIVGCSGHDGAAEKKRCKAAGMRLCIIKPFSKQDIEQALALL